MKRTRADRLTKIWLRIQSLKMEKILLYKTVQPIMDNRHSRFHNGPMKYLLASQMTS
ncbi:MAG: hypothetical protein HQM08_20720 [Candidatus Riflebacteria bacterium]|nr:hypothetical protein [Candidatus Riflebacteria bacterium]